MQSKQALHILPFALLGRNASSALRHRVRDELVYDAETLGFVERLGFEGFARLLWRGSSADAMNPVADSAAAVSDI